MPVRIKGMSKSAPILIADDDENDLFLMRIAFTEAGVANPLFTVQDGQQAVEYLSGEGPYADRQKHPLPELFLLDLKMPLMDGFDVLAWLQKRPELRGVPVVVLSSSLMEQDRLKARGLGAADFQTKPADLWNLVKIVSGLHATWLSKTEMSSE